MSFAQPNPRPYRSSDWSDITAAGMPRAKYLLPPECPIQLAAYGYSQTFQMAFAAFNPFPVAKNTPSTDFSADCTDANAILTEYSQPNDEGGGLATFDASFHRVPAAWDDFTKSIAFAFPGAPGLIGGGGRNTFTETVPLRQLREFFVLDPDNILSSAAIGGGPVNALSLLDSAGAPVKCVASLADIPFIPKTQIVSAPSGTPEVHLFSQVVVQAGGVTIGNTGWYETLPTREAFYNLAVNASAAQWNSTVWGGTNTIPTGVSNPQAQFVALDSQIEPYAGNIVCRVTGYILCK